MALPGLVAANNLSDVADRERAWDNLGSSLATGDIAIPAPSLDLNFAVNKNLVDDISGNNLITFSRASPGTYADSDGLIKTAASGVPRFDHNAFTGESLGLLIEESRTNLVSHSENFSGAGWVPTVGGTTVTSSAGIAPNNTNSASLITASAGAGGRGFQFFSGIGFPLPLTASCFVKAGTTSLSIGMTDLTTGDAVITVNLANGALIGSTFGGSWTSGSYEIEKFPNEWWRVSVTARKNAGVGLTAYLLLSTSGNALAWGFQLEVGTFPTSYISTSGSQITRAADVAEITGANFSSWFNSSTGTVCASTQTLGVEGGSARSAWSINDDTFNNELSHYNLSPNYFRVCTKQRDSASSGAWVNSTTFSRITIGASYDTAAVSWTYNGTVPTSFSNVGALLATKLEFGMEPQNRPGSTYVKRFTYWPTRLNNAALQEITQESIDSINKYAFNYVINGKDVLALNAVRNASTRDFIFIKGLLSAAQPRLTAAAATISSGLTLAANALPKLAPISSGNYLFASGLALSGVTTRINGTNALSIATSPFSGSTATVPLLFRELRPQANWRIAEPMPSGTIASPELAIPFEANNFVLFMKAGQN